ncbi:DNA polymerase delta subunit 1, partial [Puccinia graminis f. sp. tritici CRL 75-36-700-3]
MVQDGALQGRKGVFPDARLDPVIQIANMVTAHGSMVPFIRNVFTLNSCSHIAGSQVLEFKSEDQPLLDRAKALKVASFPYLGRMRNSQTAVKETHFSSKAYGTRDSKETRLDGRLQLDLLQVGDHPLSSVSRETNLLTHSMDNVQVSRKRTFIIRSLPTYKMVVRRPGDVSPTLIWRVPFNYLLSRGQQIKVVSQLYRRANEHSYLVPTLKHEGSDEPYDGATVMEPVRGFYDVPIATLDFASLYPSIMMAHNLCYTTLTDVKTPIETCVGLNRLLDYFVKASKRKGLLAIVLEDLLSARKRARAELKLETDPFKRAVLDGRQLSASMLLTCKGCALSVNKY